MQLFASDRSDTSQVSSPLVVFTSLVSPQVCLWLCLKLGLRMKTLLPLISLILIARLISLSHRIQKGIVRTHFKV